MADSSLDDFFAKKDKSKKKSKSKSQLGDGDDVSKTEKKVKKKRDKDPNSTGNSQNSSGSANVREDEEWRDFEEEKEVDYTGLRIQNMQIAKEEQERDQADADDEVVYDEDGEVREKKDAASGPWKKSNEPPSAPAPVAEPVAKEEAPPAAKTPGRYVPPSMRNQSQQSSTAAPAYPSRRKKTAPNLHSEEDFPTLGGGPVKNSPYSSSGSSDLIENPSQRKGGNLTLENKFSALQD